MGTGGIIKMVNGTPFSWRWSDSGRKNMSGDTGDFPERVEPWSMATVYIEFHNFGDFITSGDIWMEYWLETTKDKKFRIRADSWDARTKFTVQLWGMYTMNHNKGDEIDLGFHKMDSGRATVFMLSGMDEAFLLSGGPDEGSVGQWMQWSLSRFGNRTLRQICIPASHNSGMTGDQSHRRPALSQYHEVKDQLRCGIRLLEIQPVKSGDSYYCGFAKTSHTNVATGQNLNDVVNQINDFTRDAHEVIILYISEGHNASQNLRPFNKEDWNGFLSVLERLDHRYRREVGDLTALPLNEFIGAPNNNSAAVVTIVPWNEDNEQHSLGPRFRDGADGFFHRNHFPLQVIGSKATKASKNGHELLDKLGKFKGGADMVCLNWWLGQNFDWLGLGTTALDELLDKKHVRTDYQKLIDQAMDGLKDFIEDLGGDSPQPLLGANYEEMRPRLLLDLLPKCDGASGRFPSIVSIDAVKGADAAAVALAISTKLAHPMLPVVSITGQVLLQ